MYVITGASDGLGLALANILVAKDKKVVSLSRTAPKGHVKRTTIGHVVCDLTNEGSINAAVQEVLAMDEPIEALVHCAGAFGMQMVDQLTGRDLALMFTTNIIGPELLTARLLDRLKQDKADIVTVASTAGFKGNPGQAAYGSSKWALRGFAQVLREELRGTGCRVISFCPGGMNTNLFKKVGIARETNGWMQPADVANFMWQILCLPKNMEVSEVIINRA